MGEQMTNDELRTELQDVKNKLDEIMQMIRISAPWIWPGPQEMERREDEDANM